MKILSHPFRLTGTGAIAVVEQESDQGHGEQVVVLLLTVPGERHLVPTFGARDMAFRGFDELDVRTALDAFGPPVTLVTIGVTPVSDTVEEVLLEFA